MPIKTQPRHSKNPAHVKFVEGLNVLFGLQSVSPGNLRWVDDADKKLEDLGYAPRPQVSVREDLPGLSIPIIATDNGTEVGSFYAPLLMTDVRPLMHETDLLKFPVRRRMGVEGDEGIIRDGPWTLGGIMHDYETGKDFGYKRVRETPLVEVVGFVPIAEGGEFGTEFAVEMSSDGVREFAYPLIVE